MDWESVRQDFAVTRNYNYQNHAGIAPLHRRAAEAIREYADQVQQNVGLDQELYQRAERIRQRAAELLNANADEVTFVKNTSEGLSLVANGLNWNSGDNIVTTNAEFPANIYPWQALQNRGVKLRMVLEEDGRIPLEKLIEAVDSRTRVLTISSVQYASGFRSDLTALGDFCQSKGVFFCVDAIQSLGVFPIDVKAMNIDFLAADGHKWLCGPEGAGLFYVRKEVQGHLRPTCIGWASVKDMWQFHPYHFEFHDSARRYDSGSYNLPGIFGLGASIDWVLELGVERISQRLLHLTDRLVTGLQAKGYRIISPRQRSEASGIVAFVSDLHDLEAIQSHLQTEHRIVIAARRKRLRASPHVYNTEREIDQLIAALPKH
ncbi:MAG: aminotransferase class V-fold PLP-dependent enzyme [Phycisphaerae bacterium]|nr:aminotransferase class V-fold PLP-dependent enzyme [Phycisphaerae bacterium]